MEKPAFAGRAFLRKHNQIGPEGAIDVDPVEPPDSHFRLTLSTPYMMEVWV
jgi:hypothetical protein